MLLMNNAFCLLMTEQEWSVWFIESKSVSVRRNHSVHGLMGSGVEKTFYIPFIILSIMQPPRDLRLLVEPFTRILFTLLLVLFFGQVWIVLYVRVNYKNNFLFCFRVRAIFHFFKLVRRVFHSIPFQSRLWNWAFLTLYVALIVKTK